jgi:phosphoenolpyruvate phosphomutase
MRSQVPAMQCTAQSILLHHRAMQADAALMPFQEIICLIPARCDMREQQLLSP